MKEKTIAQGNFTKLNILVIASIALSILSFIISRIIWDSDESFKHYFYDAVLPNSPEGVFVFFWLSIIFILLAVFFGVQMSFCEITVTDKRVYGKAAFGKIVDLPFDKISSVGTCFPKGIVVATSSGVIKFWLLLNQEEVYTAISDLLKERQEKQVSVGVIKESSEADELKKYKDLLDSGVISQEEFDAKKKQLLGL